MLRYRLLGPLTVERDDTVLDLGTPKQRALLAVLLQQGGSPVSNDRIVDAVWGDDQPPSVQSSLHANVSRLRRLLRDDASAPSPIARRAGGYVLDLDRAEVDVELFERDAAAAVTAVDQRDWARAVEAARRALALWRGGYLDDLRDEEWVRVAAAPLLERQVGVQQNLLVGLLGTGDIADAVARSTALVSEHPLAERATWLHLVALYRAGRTPDALDAFRAFSDRLADELGLDVGPALRDLHAAILNQDPELSSWPGAPATPVPAVVEPEPEPGRTAEQARPRTPAADALPLVGRTSELEIIDAALARARTDQAGWIVIAGPAGMGKSRLAAEAMARWQAEGGTVARGQSPDLDDVPAWWPVRQLLRNLGTDPDAVLAPVATGDADAARFTVLEHAADVIRSRLDEQPLLVVVDDIHWADRASLTFLTMLAETVTEAGFAVVLTTRPTTGRPELERLLTTLARRPDSRRLTLAGLGTDDVAHLVEQVSGYRPGAADVTGLTTRTGGTPFYVVEYARLPSEQRSAGQIPPTVRSVLQQRFAGLPEPVLEILRAAAVVGEPLDVPLLAAVTRRSADEVADLLDAAADLELLTASADSASYAFSHALLRDELEAGVPDLRRRRLHARAADTLTGSALLPDVLRRARHLDAAGPLADPAIAYPAFRAAATAADERWLSESAATWWAAAITAYDRLPDPDPAEREFLISARLRAMAWAGQAQAVLDVLDAALLDALRDGRTSTVGRLAATLLRVSGSWPWPVYGADPAPLMTTLSGLGNALRDDPGALARVLAVTAIGRCYDPDPRVPDDMSRRAIELAESTGDDAVLADALLGRALTYSGVASPLGRGHRPARPRRDAHLRRRGPRRRPAPQPGDPAAVQPRAHRGVRGQHPHRRGRRGRVPHAGRPRAAALGRSRHGPVAGRSAPRRRAVPARRDRAPPHRPAAGRHLRARGPGPAWDQGRLRRVPRPRAVQPDGVALDDGGRGRRRRTPGLRRGAGGGGATRSSPTCGPRTAG